ncbi:MAG: hypothetical protein ACN6O6_03115 [Pseudomonas sp.]|uniref:hypothetical protein n=1 Tax=Pseudomonas sp. TaxID=306 RepID=UPI003D14789F
MDARFSFTRHPLVLGLSLLSLALAGCSSTPKVPEVHPGLAVFDKSIGLPPYPSSIVREGDRLTYIVMSPDNQFLYARFDASCAGTTGSMSYPTNRGMATFAERGAATNALPEPQRLQLLQSPQLQQACAQRPAPDWRALEHTEGKDWLMLDRNSLQRENGLLHVWIGHNPLHYTLIEKGAALTGQTQERLTLNCEQQSLMRVSQFAFDTRGNVYNGGIDFKATLQPLAEASADQQRAFKAACQPDAELAKLPVATARTPLPPAFSTPEAAPQVIAAIKALNLPTPSRTLSHVRYSYDVEMINGLNAPNMSQEVFITPDAASGQVLLQVLDPVLKPRAIQLSFRGLFELAGRSINKETGKEEADDRPVIDLAFTGDWQTLPLNAEVRYTRTFAQPPSPKDGATSYANTVTCRVGRERPANSLNRELTGVAKPLECFRIKTRQINWSEDFWYLADYGMFVKASDNSPLGFWTWRIESVK